jgi:hypothetical protein
MDKVKEKDINGERQKVKREIDKNVEKDRKTQGIEKEKERDTEIEGKNGRNSETERKREREREREN